MQQRVWETCMEAFPQHAVSEPCHSHRGDSQQGWVLLPQLIQILFPQLTLQQLSALLHGQSLPVWLVYCRSHEPEVEPTPPWDPRAWTGTVSITKKGFTATSQRGCRGFSHTTMAKVIPLPQLHQPKELHKGFCLSET